MAEPAAPADGGRDPGFWDFNGLSCVQSAGQISQELDGGGEVALVDLGVTREGHFFSLGRR